MKTYDIVILGSGPAGGTAAIYAARANMSTAMITGPMPGGQPSTTAVIENFPGFPEGVKGPEMGQLVEQQARQFGAEIIFDVIQDLDLSKRPFTINGQSEQYQARALVIATGSSPRTLGLAAEREFLHRGVSYCATCDGRFFEGKVVGIVGGGDSALEEALYLSHLARKVYVIHRRDELRAGPLLEKRSQEQKNIVFLWNRIVDDLKGGSGGLTAAVLRDTQTGETEELELDGLFIAIGHTPNTTLFEGQLELDDNAYIVADRQTHTSVEGVFVGGDVADSHFRQAITAAGTGCAAAMSAVRFLEAEEGR